MHLPTPHLHHRTSEKRKASETELESEVHHELDHKESTHPQPQPSIKLVKPHKKKARAKPKKEEDLTKLKVKSMKEEKSQKIRAGESTTTDEATPAIQEKQLELRRRGERHSGEGLAMRDTPHASPEPEHEDSSNRPSRLSQSVSPDPEAASRPRRSSRLKSSMNKLCDQWDKARPYIERINGTIMPLEQQGTKSYYARDGVKV